MKFRLFPVTPAFVLLAACDASAAVTLSTANLTEGGNEIVSWNSWKGQSFTVPAGADSRFVDSVALRLEYVIPNANFVVRVVGGKEGTGVPDMADVRAHLQAPDPPPGTAVALITFYADPLNSRALTAESTYWIIAGMTAEDPERDSAAGLIRWSYATANGQDPGAAPGWTVGSRTASSGTAGSGWFADPQTPFLFSLSTTPVPEPGASILLGAALVLTLPRRRHP